MQPPSTPRSTHRPIEHSEFYQLLTTPEFQPLYDQASQECKTICIPPDHHVLAYAQMVDSLKSKLQVFIKSHILRDSPVLQGQYFTDQGGQCLREIDSEELAKEQSSQQRYGVQPRTYHKVLLTTKGFRTRFRVNVVAEETFYNQDYKPFRMWFTDKCIMSEHEQIMERAIDFVETSDTSNADFDHEPDNLREFETWLRRLDTTLFEGLQNYIRVFNTSYVLLKGFEQQTVQRINDYQEQLLYDYLDAYPDIERDSDRQFLLKNAINSVLIAGMYEKLFQYWQQAYEKEDSDMEKAISNIAYITMSDLEIPEEFQCNQRDAIECMRSIAVRQNPYEKMKCIKNTTDAILISLNKHLALRSLPSLSGDKSSSSATSSSSTQSGVPLTTDELLPILAYVIIKAKPKNISSNVQFATYLQISDLSASEYSFSLVSMEAACEFIRRESSERFANGVLSKPSVIHSPSSSTEATTLPLHLLDDADINSLPEQRQQPEQRQRRQPEQRPRLSRRESNSRGSLRRTQSMAPKKTAKSPTRTRKPRTPRSARPDQNQDTSFSIIQQFEKKLNLDKIGNQEADVDTHVDSPTYPKVKNTPRSFNVNVGNKHHDIGGLLDLLDE